MKETLAVRNNSPGNLRDPATGGYQSFSDPVEGKAALYNDLTAKMTGTSTTGLHGESSLLEFAKVYAPASDKNDPVQYAANLANKLGVSPDTKIGTLQPRIDEFAHAVATNEDPSGEHTVQASQIPQSAPQQQEQPQVNPFSSGAKQPVQSTENSQNPFAQQSEPQAPKPGFLQDLASSAIQPFQRLGLSATNAVGSLFGSAPTTSQQNIFDENKTVEPVNIVNGQKVGVGRTLGNIAGDVAQTVATVGLPGEGGALLQAGKGLGTKVLQGGLTLGKYGALQSGGNSLSQGNDLKTVAKDTAIGGSLGFGAGLTFPLGSALLGKGLSKIADTGIMEGTAGLGAKAKQSYANLVDSGLGKHAKGTGETMFDYGISHNQTGNDAAYQIRNEIASPLNEKLTQVLKTQGNYTPVQDWLDSSISNIKSGTGVYKNTKAEVERHISDVLEDPSVKPHLIQNADGGFSLPDWKLNELKQQNWENAQFSFGGDPASTVKAKANKAMGQGARKIIEKNTENLDVGGYNKELGRLYNTADVLEKKGDKQIFSPKNSHLVSKVLGGIAGSPQGIMGTIVGAQTADAVASQLVKLPMYLRQEVAAKFAEKGKSQLFDDATALLEKMNNEKANRLALPAPDMSTYPIPMGGKATPPANIVGNNFTQNMRQAKNTLNLPAPSSNPIYMNGTKPKPIEIKVTDAKKGLVGQNPKTGKFFGTYNSQPKK